MIRQDHGNKRCCDHTIYYWVQHYMLWQALRITVYEYVLFVFLRQSVLGPHFITQPFGHHDGDSYAYMECHCWHRNTQRGVYHFILITEFILTTISSRIILVSPWRVTYAHTMNRSSEGDDIVCLSPMNREYCVQLVDIHSSISVYRNIYSSLRDGQQLTG